jgi:hypothetical protein
MQVTGEMKGPTAKPSGPGEGTATIAGKIECPYSPELFDEAAALNGVSVQITFGHVSNADEKYHKFMATGGVTKVTSAKDTGDAEEEGGEVERTDTMDFAFSCQYTPDLFAKLLRWQGPNQNLMFGVEPSQTEAFEEPVERRARPKQERIAGTGGKKGRGK